MEIQLLGTASAEGWPGLFCGCDICARSRVLRGKNLRTRSSALIDGALKIDLPPDTLCHVHGRGLDMTRVEHLLFTHGHDDHVAVAELQYRSWMFVREPAVQPLHILAPPDVLSRIRSEHGARDVRLDLQCAVPWQTADLGRWQVTPIAAQHEASLACVNYLVESAGRALLYATDTGWYEAPTWAFLAGRRMDAAVLECTKGLDPGGYKAHLSVPEVIRMREELVRLDALRPDALVVTTHHSHLSGLLHEDLERHLNPHGIQVGYDGMVLTI